MKKSSKRYLHTQLIGLQKIRDQSTGRSVKTNGNILRISISKIGMDYSELHFLINDVKGDYGEPLARLTPPGWTCIGNNNSSFECTQYGRSSFANKIGEFDQRPDKLSREFWEIKKFGHRE